MKKVISILATALIIVLMAALFLAGSMFKAEAEGLTEDIYTYAVNDDGETVTITTIEKPTVETELIIPDTLGGKTVTDIGEKALNWGSTNKLVTKLVIPNTVKTIGAQAFDNNRNIKELVIPESVTTIGAQAFFRFDALENLTIGSNVITVGEAAFGRTPNLKIITITGGNNENFKVENDCLVDVKNKTVLTGLNVETIVTPKGVETIDAYAFYGKTALKTVVLSDGIKLVKNNAFNAASNLATAAIAKTLTNVDSTAFPNTKLTKVFYEGSETDKAGLTIHATANAKLTGAAWTYGACINNTTDWTHNVDSTGKCTFCNKCDHNVYDNECDTICNVCGAERTAPHSYNWVIDKEATCSSGLKHQLCTVCGAITNENTVIEPMYAHTYDNECDAACNVCGVERTALHSYNWVIDVEPTFTTTGLKHEECTLCSATRNENTIIDAIQYEFDYEIIDGTVKITKYTGTATEVFIPSNLEGYPVTVIGNYAFYSCDTLRSIVISNSVTSIGNYAFYSCDSLTSMVIPDSVSSIGERIFDSCDNLKEIIVSEGNMKYHSSNNCIVETATKTLVVGCSTSIIPSDGSVTTIGDYAFYNCSSLTSIVITDSVTSIGNRAFYGCTSLTSINVNNNNINYLSQDGILFNKDKTILIQYPARKTNTTYIIPDSVTSIGDGAFYNCTSLTSIVIPDSVTTIGVKAFYYTRLTSVTIPDSVTSISDIAFGYCTSLTSVTIGDSVTSIGDYAFSDCRSLTDVWYEGASQANISIGSNNEYLTSATWHYNSCMENDDTHEHKYDGVCDAYCNNCKKVRDAADHSCEWTQTIAPTCITVGEETGTCTVCGETETREVEATGIHLFDSEDDEQCNTCDYIRYVVGELDENEGITDADAIYLLLHTYFPEDYPISQPCDFDGNGKVDDQDAVHLLFYTYFPEFYPIPEAPKYEIIAPPKDDDEHDNVEVPDWDLL